MLVDTVWVNTLWVNTVRVDALWVNIACEALLLKCYGIVFSTKTAFRLLLFM